MYIYLDMAPISRQKNEEEDLVVKPVEAAPPRAEVLKVHGRVHGVGNHQLYRFLHLCAFTKAPALERCAAKAESRLFD